MPRTPCKQSGELCPETGRPLCMHGVAMKPSSNKGQWQCRVSRRANQRDSYRAMTPEQIAQKNARLRNQSQTPGMYRYNEAHGIGIIGMNRRFSINKRHRAIADAKDLKTYERLREELIGNVT